MPIFNLGGPPRPPANDTPGPGPGNVTNPYMNTRSDIRVAHGQTLAGPPPRPPVGTPVQEYTQQYVMGPEDIAPAPLGLEPKGPDMPGTYPAGYEPVTSQNTGQSIEGTAGQVATGQQYVQRYPEGYVVGNVPYIAGLRGSARTLAHYPDPLIEPSLGPIQETNRGYPYTYLRSVVRSYKPGQEFQSVFVNGKAVRPGKFKAQAIAEINANKCD